VAFLKRKRAVKACLSRRGNAHKTKSLYRSMRSKLENRYA
jgi:hypothetical protein